MSRAELCLGDSTLHFSRGYQVLRCGLDAPFAGDAEAQWSGDGEAHPCIWAN